MKRKSNKLIAKFGANVRELRESKSLTLAELAKAAHIDTGDLSRIENARGPARGSPLEIVHRIAAALDVPPSRLLEN